MAAARKSGRPRDAKKKAVGGPRGQKSVAAVTTQRTRSTAKRKAVRSKPPSTLSATAPARGRAQTLAVRRSGASVLVLHLDADKLKRQKLHFGALARATGAIGALIAEGRIELHDTTTRRSLLDLLAKLSEENRRFDAVVVIGHSNRVGIQVASDAFEPWDVFAAYLEHVSPKRLIMLACEAGNWPAAKVLFGKLPRLDRVFASPVLASKDFGEFLMLAMPVIAFNGFPDAGVITLMQATSVATTGGQLRHWTRSDMNDPDGTLLDLLARAGDPLAQQIPSILRELLSSKP